MHYHDSSHPFFHIDYTSDSQLVTKVTSAQHSNEISTDILFPLSRAGYFRNQLENRHKYWQLHCLRYTQLFLCRKMFEFSVKKSEFNLMHFTIFMKCIKTDFFPKSDILISAYIHAYNFTYMQSITIFLVSIENWSQSEDFNEISMQKYWVV